MEQWAVPPVATHFKTLPRNEGLKIAPKMRDAHVNLTSYSVMKVNLAVQTLKHCHDAGKHATAEYCSLMNDFFDIMNVRNMSLNKILF